MKPGRLFSIALLAFGLNFLLSGAAFALFGFGSSDTEKSGLDFSRGYDVNTVTTLTGRAVTAPQTRDSGQVFVEIGSGAGKATLYLGPGSFWERKGIAIRPNDELAAKGSIAQGKDGKVYLLTQKVSNRTTGTQLRLRDNGGEPDWSGRMNERESGGRMQMRHGGMMRGGGMMRH